ncbi:hypothetical protein EDB81DRAFT_799052 [Dactylonectria macrodidyma]|uniref:Uncharacterized protein n=1 Tax=Dactylonectria macrodidyma TaxID=307937 RepID=A0A9P9EJX7_9HYPO|nr:hypothetical protein EDB81DRAFT_799052 [Dactylonectria macrodidyma]
MDLSDLSYVLPAMGTRQDQRSFSAEVDDGIGALLTRFPTPLSHQEPVSPVAGKTSSMQYDDNFQQDDVQYHAISTGPTSPRKSSLRPDSQYTQRRPSTSGSYVSTLSKHPPPSKPLPALPSARTSHRVSSNASFTSVDTTQHSRSSRATSGFDGFESLSLRSSVHPRHPSYPPLEAADEPKKAVTRINVVLKGTFESENKRKNGIHYLDLSSTSSTLASKHGKNVIRIWSVASETVLSTLKFSAYTEAQTRSREYLIRSHAILSESSGLIVIATRFGHSLEIWRWTDRKCLQSIDDADRWAACQFRSYEMGQGALALYHGDKKCIDIYTVAKGKKPLTKLRSIDLRKADLPCGFQYPELALSATSPMLVAAAGPRQTRAGHPPPDREVLLAAWEIHDDSDLSNTPFKLIRPEQHRELETALPCELATYGSAVVSIWIPSSYQVLMAPITQTGGGGNYYLSPTSVPFRYVLVWDLVSNSTRTFRIPNTVCCISPDCRLVAYCEASKNNMGGRGCLAILDITTGKEIWCWPDRDATAMDSGPKAGYEQFENLDRITQLAFSADGKSLVLGDMDGQSCIYDIV